MSPGPNSSRGAVMGGSLVLHCHAAGLKAVTRHVGAQRGDDPQVCSVLLTQLQLSSPSAPLLSLTASPGAPQPWLPVSPAHRGLLRACSGLPIPTPHQQQPGPWGPCACSPAHVPVPSAEHPPTPSPTQAGRPPACKPTGTHFACSAAAPLAFLRRLLLRQGFYWDSCWTHTAC